MDPRIRRRLSPVAASNNRRQPTALRASAGAEGQGQMRTSKSSIGKDLALARRSLQALNRSLARLTAQVREAFREKPGRAASRPRRKLRLSSARLKALKHHGRYLGYIRQLKPRQREEVKALRARKGVRAATKRARKLAAG